MRFAGGSQIVAEMDADTTHEWARLALLRMLARLLEQLRRGSPLAPLVPWEDTRPDVRPEGDA